MVKIIRILVIFVIISSLAWYGWNNKTPNNRTPVFSSWLEGEEYRVMADTSGKVVAILVQEGQQLQVGQQVAKLDDQVALIQLTQAQANLAAARAKAGDVQSASRPQQIAQANNQVKALQASLAGAAENLKRARQLRQKTEQLLGEGGATPDQLDNAKTSEATALATTNNLQAQIQAAQEQLSLIKAGATSYTLSASAAQVELASSQVDLARLQVSKAKLIAPAKGRVEQVVLKPGELANPGTTVVKLVDDTKLHVTVYVPQSQLSQVKIGQKVKVITENSSTETQGEIVFISSQGEFTPKNIQTQEQRANQVFAVKVALVSADAGNFKPGQAVEVRLD